jgi:hypothetical protein
MTTLLTAFPKSVRFPPATGHAHLRQLRDVMLRPLSMSLVKHYLQVTEADFEKAAALHIPVQDRQEPLVTSSNAIRPTRRLPSNTTRY